MLRRIRGNYMCAPETSTGVLLAVVRRLDVEIAFTMPIKTVDIILSALEPAQDELTMNDGSQFQVVDSLAGIFTMRLRKYGRACLIRNESLLVVCHDDLQYILSTGACLEEKLLLLASAPL